MSLGPTETDAKSSFPWLVLVVPIVLQILQGVWTLRVLTQYEASMQLNRKLEGSGTISRLSFDETYAVAKHYHDRAFVWPDRITLFLLVVYFAVIALLWWRKRPSVVWATLGTSVVAVLTTQFIFLNSYFRYFKMFT